MGDMILSAKARFGFQSEAFVGLVEQHDGKDGLIIRRLDSDESPVSTIRFGATPIAVNSSEIILPDDLGYLMPGDMIRLNPQVGEARVLYRRNSKYNTLFFTERCNSHCLMCSQPPRDINDDYLVEDILRMIPWMAKDTPELGITGGEPTLLHERLISVLEAAKTHLPLTALHMLSNGRLFSYFRYAQQVSSVQHPEFMIGVPLYADTCDLHDFVVQSRGAFEQTVFGLMNLARVGLRVEIRMVVHKHTYNRLPQFARFIARNLPFVDQVVIMGLELTGFARSNRESLWIDPMDYQDQLEACVQTLDDAGIKVHVYNHQLCLLRPSLHRFARKSISDWKNIYLPECEQCTLKSDCGGFFASALLRHSPNIRAVLSN
ncbi:MAG: His-Xaa-Ser system radical SAM maturase HxsC [Lacunisphaera sp.]